MELAGSELLRSPGVRLAVPTRFTRRAGVAGWVAVVAWLVAAAGWWGSVVVERQTGRFDGAPQRLYLIGAAALWVAVTSTAVMVAAVCRRQGDRSGRARLAVGCAVAGVAVTAMPWAMAGWVGFLAAAGLVVLASSWRTAVLPRYWLVPFGGAWTAAAVMWVVLHRLQVGWRDEWGSYPLASTGAVTVGAVLIAAGGTGVARRPVAEEPVIETSLV